MAGFSGGGRRLRDEEPLLGVADLIELSVPVVKALKALAELEDMVTDMGLDDRDPPTYGAVVNARQALTVARERLVAAGFAAVKRVER